MQQWIKESLHALNTIEDKLRNFGFTVKNQHALRTLHEKLHSAASAVEESINGDLIGERIKPINGNLVKEALDLTNEVCNCFYEGTIPHEVLDKLQEVMEKLNRGISTIPSPAPSGEGRYEQLITALKNLIEKYGIEVLTVHPPASVSWPPHGLFIIDQNGILKK